MDNDFIWSAIDALDRISFRWLLFHGSALAVGCLAGSGLFDLLFA